jgi:putative peptide maturation system protein
MTIPVTLDLASVLADAVTLLRDLPRDRHAAPEARRRVAAWNQARPAVAVRLVVDAPPGSVRIDHDLLVTFPGVGTLALSWREDTGSPWLVCYADHWAANFVLTLDDERRLTVQQALLLLRSVSDARPDLMTKMVDHLILEELGDDETLAASSSELQGAADQFRRNHGLTTAVATETWLAEHRLSEAALTEMIEQSVRIEKGKDRLGDARIAALFESDRPQFDRVQVVQVVLASSDRATVAAREARTHGLLGVVHGLAMHETASVTTRFARDLPSSLKMAKPGEIVGPILDGATCVLYQVLDRRAAQLDEETRALARQLVCDAWIAERRARAVVRWHWV